MKLLTFTMPRDFNLYQWGDSHEGTKFQLTHGVDDLIETIMQDKMGYSFHVGDWAESRTIDHPYYVHDQAKVGSATVLEQIKVVRKQLEPLAKSKKLLWINKGNHEKSVDSFGNSTEFLCKELDVKYGTWTTKAGFVDKKQRPMFKGYWCHGFIKTHTITPPASVTDPDLRRAHARLKIRKMLAPKASDCVIMGMGHYHINIVRDPASELIVFDDGKKIKQGYTNQIIEQTGFNIHPDNRWYTVSGSFYRLYMDGYDSYGEIAGLNPTELGYIKIHVRDGNIVRVEPVIIS